MGNIQTVGLNEAVLISGEGDKQTSKPLIWIAMMQTSHWRKHILNVDNISGGCCGSTSKKTVVGGWAWAWWLVTDVQRWGGDTREYNIPGAYIILTSMKSDSKYEFQIKLFIGFLSKQQFSISFPLNFQHIFWAEMMFEAAVNSSLRIQWLHCRNVCRLSLEVMTLNPICENVETAQGVPLTVTGVAQVSPNNH